MAFSPLRRDIVATTLVTAVRGAGIKPSQVVEDGYSLDRFRMLKNYMRTADFRGSSVRASEAQRRPMSTGSAALEKLVPAEAGFQITNSLNLMMTSIDSNDFETFGQQFTTDGQVDVELTRVTKRGRKEIQDLCQFLHTNFAQHTHWEGNVALRKVVGGAFRIEEIHNASYWEAKLGGETQSVGTHTDIFVLDDDGVWRCRHRTIRHLWTKAKGHIHKTESE